MKRGGRSGSVPGPRHPGRVGAAPFVAEQRAAERYTFGWHRVERWAHEVVGLMDELPPRPTGNDRIASVRASMVLDLADDEEAFERGLGLESVDVPMGPTADQSGGRRRVIIRMLTWVPDFNGAIAYNPQWIVTGHGMTPHAAAAAHARYVRDYVDAVKRGVESRRLMVTAIDVRWWTTSPNAQYL